MNTAYVVSGDLIDHETIKLSEPVPMEKGRIRIVIETQSEPMYRERPAGLWKGRITLSPDFDEPLEDLKEYPSIHRFAALRDRTQT